MGNRGAIAHALAGLRTSLAEAALVLLLLLVCLRLLLLCGGWWCARLVEAWTGGHGGLLDWGASCGAGGVLAGGEAVEALGVLGLSLC